MCTVPRVCMSAMNDHEYMYILEKLFGISIFHPWEWGLQFSSLAFQPSDNTYLVFLNWRHAGYSKYVTCFSICLLQIWSMWYGMYQKFSLSNCLTILLRFTEIYTDWYSKSNYQQRNTYFSTRYLPVKEMFDDLPRYFFPSVSLTKMNPTGVSG